MRGYAKISPTLWASRKFGKLGDSARLLYFYLHTCPQANALGCYALKPGYACADLGWTEAQFREGIDSLSKADLVGFDTEENLVRIVAFLKHDPFTNPKHAKGAMKLLGGLPECEQKNCLIKDLRDCKYVEASDLPLPGGPAATPKTDSLSEAYRNPEPEPEPEPDKEPDGSLGRAKARKPELPLPENWTPSDRNLADAESRNFTAAEIAHEADQFRDHHLARGTRFRDWDAAWRTWLGNARKFANRGVAGPTAAGGHGQGGSIASIAARRRAQGQV